MTRFETGPLRIHRHPRTADSNDAPEGREKTPGKPPILLKGEILPAITKSGPEIAPEESAPARKPLIIPHRVSEPVQLELPSMRRPLTFQRTAKVPQVNGHPLRRLLSELRAKLQWKKRRSMGNRQSGLADLPPTASLLTSRFGGKTAAEQLEFPMDVTPKPLIGQGKVELQGLDNLVGEFNRLYQRKKYMEASELAPDNEAQNGPGPTLMK